MYFVYRDGRYIDASGQSFRDFMAGRLPALPGERPTLSDWGDHLTTAFPEVRLKRYLEMRGADAGSWRSLCGAAGACGPGCSTTTRRWTPRPSWCATGRAEDHAWLRAEVPQDGAGARRSAAARCGDVAREVVAIAKAGLAAPRPDRLGRPGRDPLPQAGWSRSPPTAAPRPRRSSSASRRPGAARSTRCSRRSRSEREASSVCETVHPPDPGYSFFV